MSLKLKLVDLSFHMTKVLFKLLQLGSQRFAAIMMRCDSKKENFRYKVGGALYFACIKLVGCMLVCVYLGLVAHFDTGIPVKITRIYAVDLLELV